MQPWRHPSQGCSTTPLIRTRWTRRPLCGRRFYANDAAFAAHVSNPPVQAYLQKHAELGDSFSIEVYGTVGDDCRTLMESFGLPLKIFETRLGYSRV